MCARHILANWSKEWRGLQRRNQFWKCAKSTFEGEMKINLDKMKQLGTAKDGKDIVADLLYYPPETWCKLYFRTDIKCDSVDNNMSESFNAWILGPRHKTIITMLEEIRVKVMTRIGQLSQFPKTWLTNISPMALRVLEINIKKSMECNIDFNGERGFEISDGPYQHTVDLRNRTCSCRAWMLKGIPCQHALAAILYKKYEPIEFVDSCYSKETYLRTYCHFLQPVTNMKMWPESNNPYVAPPVVKPMPGRPKKVRRREATESKRYGKLSRKGVDMTCSICHGKNHNKRGCPLKV